MKKESSPGPDYGQTTFPEFASGEALRASFRWRSPGFRNQTNIRRYVASYHLMTSSGQWIRLAQILRPQGRKGEVLADLYTEAPEQFESNGTIALAQPGFAERSERGEAVPAPEPVQVIAHWLPVGRNAGRVVLHFAGVSSIDQAEALAGKEVVIQASERRDLEDGAVYVADLVGTTVLDGEVSIGEIREVLFPATPDGSRKLEDAAPLLSVTSREGDEILIPFASAYVVEIDLPNRRLRMNLPEGLVEVNRPGIPNSISEQE